MTWRFALLMMIATRAWACSCAGDWPSVKQAWEKTPFVFLGTVEVADSDQDSSQTIFQAQSVRIRVDAAFKGVSKGQTIELHQSGTDCDAKFRTGQRAVFYLLAGVLAEVGGFHGALMRLAAPNPVATICCSCKVCLDLQLARDFRVRSNFTRIRRPRPLGEQVAFPMSG